MIGTDICKSDSALLDLEGILHAIDLVRLDGLNIPGPECLAVLSKVAVEKAAELRAVIFPGHDGEARS